MRGELFAAQVHEAIAAELGQTPNEAIYVGRPAVGRFLKQRVFAPGKRFPWNELTERMREP